MVDLRPTGSSKPRLAAVDALCPQEWAPAQLKPSSPTDEGRFGRVAAAELTEPSDSSPPLAISRGLPLASLAPQKPQTSPMHVGVPCASQDTTSTWSWGTAIPWPVRLAFHDLRRLS